jgi:hypothetical protein
MTNESQTPSLVSHLRTGSAKNAAARIVRIAGVSERMTSNTGSHLTRIFGIAIGLERTNTTWNPIVAKAVAAQLGLFQATTIKRTGSRANMLFSRFLCSRTLNAIPVYCTIDLKFGDIAQDLAHTFALLHDLT